MSGPSTNWTYYRQKGEAMEHDQIRESLENIEKQLSDRANQLLAADPVARELIGLKKGLELGLGGGVNTNGEVPREETLEAVAGG